MTRYLLLGVLLSCLALASSAQAAGVAVTDAGDEQKADAQQAFQLGDAEFDVQNYTSALEHFRASLAIVDSPNTRLMVARCLLELNQLDVAFAEYGTVLDDVDENDERYAAARETAQKERVALRSRLAWLTVERGDVPPDVPVIVGGQERTAEQLKESIGIMPGKTEITAGDDAGAEVYLAAGRSGTVQLKAGEVVILGTPRDNAPNPAEAESAPPDALAPTPEEVRRNKPLRPWAYVAGGVGAAGMATFAAFGVMANERYSRLEEDCDSGICPPESEGDIEDGKTYQTIANVGLGVGVAGLTTAVVLFVLDETRPRETPVSVAIGFGSLHVRGEF